MAFQSRITSYERTNYQIMRRENLVSLDNPADFRRRWISHDSFEVQASRKPPSFSRIVGDTLVAMHLSQLRVVAE